MLKKDLVDKIASETGLAKKTVAQVVDTMLGTIMETAANGETVLLTGFGKWEGKVREPKKIKLKGFEGLTKRAPYVRFTLGKVFKETVKNAPLSKFE
jgi:DNA-binding protein HU-beta